MNKDEILNYLNQVLKQVSEIKNTNLENIDNINEAIIDTKYKIGSYNMDKNIKANHEKDKKYAFKVAYNTLSFFALLSFLLIVAINHNTIRANGMLSLIKNVGFLLAVHGSIPLVGGFIAQVKHQQLIDSINVDPSRLEEYKKDLERLTNSREKYNSISKKINKTEQIINTYLNMIQSEDNFHLEECLDTVNNLIDDYGLKLTNHHDN